jgi:catechol 2,3-dioxygenase-like lactoylglutathione lyase family enzyme
MTVQGVVPIIKVSDMTAAVDFYAVLGFTVDFRYAASPTGPWYTGLSIDGHEVHLSTFSGDGVRGTATYYYVADVDALVQRFKQAGLRTPGKPDSPVEDGPVDQTWGMREFYVRDPDGNTLRFGCRIPAAG